MASHVWVVEVRIRFPRGKKGRRGPWTKWGPMETWHGDHMSVPNCFYTKKLAKWEAKDCQRQIKPCMVGDVEYRAVCYDRR